VDELDRGVDAGVREHPPRHRVEERLGELRVRLRGQAVRVGPARGPSQRLLGEALAEPLAQPLERAGEAAAVEVEPLGRVALRGVPVGRLEVEPRPRGAAASPAAVTCMPTTGRFYDGPVRSAASPRRGAAAAVAAFLMWGLFPLYWKMLAAVPALEVVAHRTTWGFAAVAAWVTLRGGWATALAVARRPRTLLLLGASAVLIGVNWLLYVWAVAHDHVVEASLGYYVNPLVNVVLGVVVLDERLSRPQRIAVALAALGVAILTVSHGRLPWIALALAVSFGLYGLVRKTVGADAVVGLLWETALLTPPALVLLVSLGLRGAGAFSPGAPGPSALLALGGAVTAVPLVLFALGARSLPLSTVGLIQYLSPSIQFLIAVFLFREPFTRSHAAAFACIWSALALLTWDVRRRLRFERAAGRRTA
jgi:chloramphenicol-sensitive protein RarD